MGTVSAPTAVASTAARPTREQTLDEIKNYINGPAEEFIYQIRQDLRAKWDRIIIVTGKRGVGKSVLALQLAKWIDYSLHWGRLAFKPEDIHPILRSMNVYESMLMDEGGEIWGSQDWATRVSVAITKQIIGDRYLHSCRFILAPNIFYLNKRAIDMADYWIRVYSPDNRLRGYAEVRLIAEKDYVDKKLPYAPPVMEIEFDDLPEWVSKEYVRFKASKGEERMGKYQNIIQKELGEKTKAWIEPDVVAAEILANPKPYMNEHRKFDYRPIYSEYAREGLGIERAKVIAHLLNRELAPEDV